MYSVIPVFTVSIMLVLGNQPCLSDTPDNPVASASTVSCGQKDAEVAWSAEIGAPIYGSPAIFGDVVLIGSEDNYLRALDKDTGQELWQFAAKGAIRSTPLFSGDHIVFNSADGTVYCIHAGTREVVWTFNTEGEKQVDLWDFYLSSPVEHNGVVYIGSGDGHVYALDSTNGAVKWRFPTEGVVHATPLVSDGTVYIGSFDGFFYALDAQSGELKWKFDTIGDRYFPQGAVQRGAIRFEDSVIFGSRDYNIYALDAAKGTGLWNMKEIGSWVVATPTLIGKRIYFGTSDSHRFVCMDAAMGKVEWALDLNMRVYGSAVLHEPSNILFFGCFNGIFYGVDPENGKKVYSYQTSASKANYARLYQENGKFREDLAEIYKDYVSFEKDIASLGSIHSTPAISGNLIYFGNTAGVFLALDLSKMAAMAEASGTE